MKKIALLLAAATLATCTLPPQNSQNPRVIDTSKLPPGKITVRADQPGARFNPLFYGLMTEEINYSYDGGLYGELIQNRIFKNTGGASPVANTAGSSTPIEGAPHWQLLATSGAQATAALDESDPVNASALTTSLKLNIASVAAGQRVGVTNDGYWGIAAVPNATYPCNFYAKASNGFTGGLNVTIESSDGRTVHATATIPALTTKWQRYNMTLKTGTLQASANNRFVICATAKGTVNFNLVSLFPPTFKERTGAALGQRPVTGFRPDLMQLLNDMTPAFLRFPGGNYVEGSNFANRFNFKTTIGPWEERPGHLSPWSYRSSDGMGLLEFLEWCEEIKMEPVLAVYAGLNLDNARDVKTGDALKPLIQDALDEIEYVTGPVTSEWGARRAKDGHPEPFKLTYVEIGNEDFLNNGRRTYIGEDGRFNLFNQAIKAKYPQLKVIATVNPGVPHDVIDNHHYMSPQAALNYAHLYDTADRNGPKIFEGEWASQEAMPRGQGARPINPTFICALTDAAFLTGLERNADIVIMNCYAPLFCRVDPTGAQWRTNLIGYDSLSSFGSPAYYVQKMFFNARGDQVLPVAPIAPQVLPPSPNTPPATGPATANPTLSPGDGRNEPLYASASKEDKSGDVILKVVNVGSLDQKVVVEIAGASILKDAAGQIMAARPGDTNSIDNPTKVVPRNFTVDDASSSWTHTFPGNSITVLRLKTR